MIRGIVGSILQFQFVVVVIGVVTMLIGIVQIGNMPVDVFPEYAPPIVEVQTEALGLATAEVESLLTVPLEELLSGIPWLQTIRSRSVPGLSSIILIFEPGTDLMHARQLVRERLGLTYFTLPNVTKAPTMLQPRSATGRVMLIGLSSQELSLIEMSVLARWNIVPRLMGIPGVSNVSIWGQRRRQLQVQVDPGQMRSQGVSIDQGIRSSGNSLWFSPLEFLYASYPGSGGWIDTPQQRLGIRHVLPISAPEDLAKVSVDGTELTLGDLGQVVENHPLLIGDAVLSDGPGLLLMVEKFPGANTVDVTREVDVTLDALQLGLPGLEIDPHVFRATTYIEMAFENLGRTLLISVILLVLVFFAFHYDWRRVLISLVTIPLSLVVALLVLNQTGATLNTMVLVGLAIALGALVDDAIVDVQNFAGRLRRNRQEGNDQPPESILLQAAVELRSAMVFATLIPIVAFLPVLFMRGLAGAFFRPLALSYALALLASMVVTLSFTVALSMILLPRTPLKPRESPLVRWLHRVYDRVLAPTVQRTGLAYLLVGIVLLAGLVALPFLRLSFMPSFQESDLVIEWEGPPGTSRSEMTRLTAEAIRTLQAIPGVRSVNAHMGRALLGDEVVGINSAELWVNLDAAADVGATVAAIQEIVDDYPGLVRNVQPYLGEIMGPVLAGASHTAVVRIYGPDLAVLHRTGEEVADTLLQIDGIVDPTLEAQAEEPIVEIEVDLANSERYGLVPGDVRRMAATLVAGLEVGNLFEGQKVFDVVVWSVPAARHSLTSLGELLIDTPDGGHVRLSEVADLRVASTPNAISREANSRYIDVGFNVSGREIESVVSDVEFQLQRIEFPLEVHPELISNHAEVRAAQNRALGVAIVAVIGIFLLLQAALERWRLASLVFLAMLAAPMGGVLATRAMGDIISLGSLAGLLAVSAIFVRNAILLINHYRRLEQYEGETFGLGLVIRGTRERLAPLLMTATAVAMAFLPFVIFGGISGQEIVYTMAVVALGGLFTSTLVNLIVIPALYLRFGSSPKPVMAS